MEIADKDNLLNHALLLRKKGFTPGLDGMSGEGVVLWIKLNGERLSREIKNGTYEPMPAKGFKIAKGNGGFRRIAKLTALDTVVQNAILCAVEDNFDKLFSEKSFAYRKGTGIVQALELYRQHCCNYNYAAKIDPVACFDNIDHTVLRNSLCSFSNDKKLINLIMKAIEVPIREGGEFLQSDIGLLQGAPLSPILCNVYLHSLDIFLEKQKIEFIRYADDIVIFSNNSDDIKRKCNAAEKFMNQELGLTVNKRKFSIDSPLNTKYLGHKFIRDKKGIAVLDSTSSEQSAYRTWHETKLQNNHSAIDILSDGILRQKDFSAIFESDNQKRNIPLESTDVINIYSDVVFDSSFFKKIAESKVAVNIFDKSGNRLGSFIPDSSLKAPKITAEQITAYYDKQRRLALAKEFILGSIHNLRLNIRYYNKQNPSERYLNAIKKTYSIELKVKDETEYENLLMHEVRVREVYYSCFDSFINQNDFVFEKRSKHPPKNEVNALISFGNSLLYNFIATEINKTSLDIRIGFLHATNSRKASLNLDIAELFKPLIVDRTVFSLINHKSIKKEHFDLMDNGAVYLNEAGKRIFLNAFYEKLNTCVTVKNQSVSYRVIIKTETQKLIRHFREKQQYISFRQVR